MTRRALYGQKDTLRRLGTDGRVASLLNEIMETWIDECADFIDAGGLEGLTPEQHRVFAHLCLSERRPLTGDRVETLDALVAHLMPPDVGSRGIVEILSLAKRGAWRAVEERLLQKRRARWWHWPLYSPVLFDAHLRDEALDECRLFDRYDLRAMWCQYKSHLFVSDDPRRKDCWRHQLAGQKGRYRARHPEESERARHRGSQGTGTHDGAGAFRVPSQSLTPEAREIWDRAQSTMNRGLHRLYQPDCGRARREYQKWRRGAYGDLRQRQQDPKSLEEWEERWGRGWLKRKREGSERMVARPKVSPVRR